MNSETTVNAYLRSKVMSATPEQLRMMLIEGAIKFCAQGIAGLERKDYEQVFSGFTNCRNILLELGTSVRVDVNPELAKRVQGLYTFMYLHLVDAGLEKDMTKAKKVAELLEYERDTWKLLMDQLAAEQGNSTAQAAATPSSTSAEPHHSQRVTSSAVPSSGTRSSLSVQV